MPASTRLTEELLGIARAAAEVGARIAVTCLSDGALDVATKTKGLDVVTSADVLAQQAILETITAARPGDGFVGEEGGNRDSSSGVTWVVDPIDSTANYVRGLPMWSVSVAARDKEQTLAACVAGPAFGEAFSGGVGLGIWRNGTRLPQPPSAESLDVALGLVGWSSGERSTRRARVLDDLIGMAGRVRSPGSPALGLAWTAAGRADFAYYEQRVHEWDVAAGLALCAAAGLSIRVEHAATGPHRLLVAQPRFMDTLSGITFA